MGEFLCVKITCRWGPAAQQVTPGYLPGWFFCSVWGPKCSMSSGRAASPHWSAFWQLLLPQRRPLDLCAAVAGYLASLRYFRASANALSETDDETFTGIVSAPAFALALNSIRESYANPHSFYIDTFAQNQLLPQLDNRLGTADISQPYYVSETINYHN